MIGVFTAVIGKTDRLKDPTVVGKDVQYVCFSDRPQSSRIWRTQPVPSGDPTWTARAMKLGLHAFAQGCDAYLWVDAAYRLDVDPRVVVEQVNGSDLALFQHPDRQTVEAEAETVRTLLGVTAGAEQARAYRKDGLPATTRLSSTGFLFRRASAAVERFNELWWAELKRWQHTRDQLSVDYAAWKAGIVPVYLPGHYRDNRFACWHSWLLLLCALTDVGFPC